MKKFLLLLPLAGLLLTGCGDKEIKPLDPELPENGTEIDLAEDESVDLFVDELCENIKLNYNSLGSGFVLNGEFVLDTLDILDGEEIEVKGESLKFDYVVSTFNIDKKISEWEVGVEISNFGGKVTLFDSVPDKKKVFEASDISLSIYLKEGNLYADLSNPQLTTLAYSILQYAVPADYLPMIKSVADSILTKNNFGSIIDMFGIEDEPLLPEMTDDFFSDLKTKVVEELAELLENPEECPISLFDYEDDGLGILVEYGETESYPVTGEGGTSFVNGTSVNGHIYFDENGLLKQVYAKAAYSNLVVENGVIVSKTCVTAESGFLVSFNTGNITYPDFTDYANLNLASLISILSLLLG